MQVCPAFVEERLDGVHGGMNAGRSCWAVPETFCDGKTQGSYIEKQKDCLTCDFYTQVYREELGNFQMIYKLLNRLKGT